MGDAERRGRCRDEGVDEATASGTVIGDVQRGDTTSL